MGSRNWCTKLVRTLQAARFSHLLIFILILSEADNVNSKRSQQSCDVDKCGDHYRSISVDDDLSKKCRHLSLHRSCLKRIENACRGNLLYHTSVHINRRNLESSNCSDAGTKTSSVLGAHSASKTASKSNQCVYAGKPKFKFCSLFGDPHVRTFSDRLHTCKANGSWRLISNDYLVVRATNSLLPGQMQATAISKLTVIIRRSGECAKKKTYRAEIGQALPAHFGDGTTHTGPEKSVNITVKEEGIEIQIDIRFIATTIVVRNVGSHLTFSIQMPGDIVDNPVDETAQMCVSGCPRRQRIRLSQEITRLVVGNPESGIEIEKKYTEEQARERCRSALLDPSDVENSSRQKRGAGRYSTRQRQRKADPDLDASAATFKQLSGYSSGGKSRALARSGRSRSRTRSPASRKPKAWDSNFLQDDPGVGSFTGSRGARRNRDRAVVSSVGRGSNFYFEACVFDLMTTGDVTYAASARGAFRDVTRFHRSGVKAKGASTKVVANWKANTATVKPRKEGSVTKRTTGPSGGLSENRAQPFCVNLFLLFLCLLSTTYFANLIHLGTVFEICNSFCNGRKVTT